MEDVETSVVRDRFVPAGGVLVLVQKAYLWFVSVGVSICKTTPQTAGHAETNVQMGNFVSKVSVCVLLENYLAMVCVQMSERIISTVVGVEGSVPLELYVTVDNACHDVIQLCLVLVLVYAQT